MTSVAEMDTCNKTCKDADKRGEREQRQERQRTRGTTSNKNGGTKATRARGNLRQYRKEGRSDGPRQCHQTQEEEKGTIPRIGRGEGRGGEGIASASEGKQGEHMENINPSSSLQTRRRARRRRHWRLGCPVFRRAPGGARRHSRRRRRHACNVLRLAPRRCLVLRLSSRAEKRPGQHKSLWGGVGGH